MTRRGVINTDNNKIFHILPQEVLILRYPSILIFAFVYHVFHTQVQLYSLIMSSLPHSQQTNRCLGTRFS